MKKLFILTCIFLSCILNLQGQTFNGYPLVGMQDGVSDITNLSRSEVYYASNFVTFPSGKFYCRFIVTSEVDIDIDHCGSMSSSSSVYLLKPNGSPIPSSNYYTYDACSGLAGLKATNIPAGEYYIENNISFPQDGYVCINITTRDAANPAGNRRDNAISAGVHSGAFVFSDTRNTYKMKNEYAGRPTPDVFYTFTLTAPMDITISHCGSYVSDTYVSLLNSSGTLIASNNDHTDTKVCSNTKQAYLKQANLAAGTYYVVSEGYSLNGDITTRIEGSIPMALDLSGLNLSDDHNYIITRTYTNDAGTQYLDDIRYLDGLGRPSQLVQAKITPTGKDLVTLQEYDACGRESNTWLPAVVAANKGAYVALATVKTASTNSNGSDSYPYSLPVYEPSPLNRVVQEYGPGASWRNNSKRVITEYLSNNTTYPCRLYKSADNLTTVSISKSADYAANQLYVTKLTDEDGNVSYEFKDKLGQVVLTRTVNAGVNYDTYYIYDSYGNLRAVLPPLASDALSANSTWTDTNTALQQYAYLYKYDGQKHCIARKLPGADWEYYVYDQSDRLIFTQDGEMRTRGEWTFSIPDAFNRVVLTGTCKNTLSYTDNPLGSVTVTTTRTTNSNNTYKGYATPTGVTLTTPVILSVNYYDDYAFMGYNGIPLSTDAHFKYETVSDYGVRYTGGYKGMLTGTMTAQLNSDGTVSSSYLHSVMYYDNRGRVIQTKSNNHLSGGTEAEYFAYNFTGQTLKRKHVHAATGKSTQTELYTYAYDAAGRLTTVKHKLNSGAEITLANNSYDELGRLQTNQRNGFAALKSTYTYNVRSWMKSITSTLFTQTLYYNDTYGGSTARYNGNISAMNWKFSNESQTRGYKFTYDNLSRLTVAGYLENEVANDRFNTSYTYDKHGNMKTLMRRGNTGTSAYGIIDNLTMEYTGNQLTKVEDTGVTVSLSTSMDFKNGSNAVTEYTYNKRGSLTKDANKGITSISYNLLNLPRSLTISNNLGSDTNTYVYAANGRKLSTTISGKKTDYIGSVIYENNALKRILIGGGYIENGTYYFYLTDHLGNNRAVVSSDGVLVQSNHYYPYGMSFAEGTPTSTQPFKYGNKELDIQKGLNWYDSKARMQDPVLGFFPTMDPMAEKFYSWSPYAYCYNNPLLYTDPTGEVGEIVWDLISFGMGVKSLIDNIKAGNAGAAIVDGVGIIVDAGAALIPFVPGGASAGIKALRTADKVVDAVSTTKTAAKTVDKAADGAKAMQRGVENEKKVLESIGEVKNTKRQTVELPKTGETVTVIPDAVTDTKVIEIKDVKNLSNTKQIRGERQFAKESGREFEIITGENTHVSKGASEETNIVRRPDIGPQ